MARPCLVFLFVACVAVHSLTDFNEHHNLAVEELGDDSAESNPPLATSGGGDTHPGAKAQGGQGPGYMLNAPGIANFAGPKYGLPGYKESHNWEVGVDIFSPSVWNMQYYTAKYDLPVGQEETLKLKWQDDLLKNIAPNCPKGRIDWDLNQYALNNPSSAVSRDENYVEVPATCMMILKKFLSTGIYQGLEGWTGFKIQKLEDGAAPEDMFGLTGGGTSLTGNDAGSGTSTMPPTLTYTYSFWLRVTDRKTDDSNIMEFNGQDGTTMPTVALGLKGSTTDLVFTVAQSDNPNSLCEAVGTSYSDEQPGFLVLNEWSFVVMTVSKFHATSSKSVLWVDGAIACQTENTGGTTLEPADDGFLFLAATGKPVASAEVALVNFYPEYVFSEAEVQVQMSIEQLDKVWNQS